jgi:hypothetical protein
MNTPKAAGGPVTQFAVFPSLPAGLRLNPVTGEITGSPSEKADQTNYGVGNAHDVQSMLLNGV